MKADHRSDLTFLSPMSAWALGHRVLQRRSANSSLPCIAESGGFEVACKSVPGASLPSKLNGFAAIAMEGQDCGRRDSVLVC